MAEKYGYKAVMIDKVADGYPAGAIAIINYLKTNYAKQIKDASARWHVPEPILYAFYGVESGRGGNNLDSFDKRTVSGVSVPNTYGLSQTNGIGVNGAIKACLAGECTLGQIWPVYKAFPIAFKVIKPVPSDADFWKDEYKSRRNEKASVYFALSDQAKAFEKAKGNIKSYWDAAAKALKGDPVLSVNIGAILLSKYILESLPDASIEEIDGVKVKMARLDWVITKYNAGPNYFKNLAEKKSQTVNSDTATYITIIPGYTQKYVVKLVGKDGLLDVQKQGKTLAI